MLLGWASRQAVRARLLVIAVALACATAISAAAWVAPGQASIQRARYAGGPAGASGGPGTSRWVPDLVITTGNTASYSGLTSQQQTIAFSVASGQLRRLRFYVVISCHSHHRYRGRVWGFAAITIRHGRFAETVTSHKPVATATVSGRVWALRVRGSLWLRRYVSSERGYCAGAATFDLHRRG